MNSDHHFFRATWRLGAMAAAALIGAASAPVQAEGPSTTNSRAEIRREFETRGPKAHGTWVIRQTQARPSAVESRKQPSANRPSRFVKN
ncbi:hypothetical protein ACFSCV_15355 [Methylopila henanensis]|uniref:Uncharacterized protein n=1 Tax=Methylopila henanensis TaxID=873516 RepID=A0ABW4K889_9HYPH